MSAERTLASLLEDAARLHPDRTAVVHPGNGRISYAELQRRAAESSHVLVQAGVGAGDRVGICARKTVDSVVALFGVLQARAAYVPVDFSAPFERSAYIFRDCAVKAIIAESHFVDSLQSEFAANTLTATGSLEPHDTSDSTLTLLTPEAQRSSDCQFPSDRRDLAYILYTSGSTGKPKGVMHTHDTALSFIDWCSEEFAPSATDRFSSHAPFHFDLSILDLFVAVKHGAAVVLVDEDVGKQPMRLASLIADEQISVWYSTPSILRLLVEYGKMERYDFSVLRLVLFAGEVFPIKYLRALKDIWTTPRFYNLYGPTETNVCTFAEAPAEIRDTELEPLPIGKACSGDKAYVADEVGNEVPEGETGELYISGGSVMCGYWNLPRQNADAFHVDDVGVSWYKTGDVVRDIGAGNYVYVGRRDRMVKRRGYRVELGEIEAALYRHPEISEAAVVAHPDEESGVRVRAFLSCSGGKPPSLIALKRFSAQNLPLYMVPDQYTIVRSLPKTSTDKVDYQRLKEID